MTVAYRIGTSVLDAARERVSMVFDRFEHVVVSVSSGKDSTVLYWLAVQEAERRGRRVRAFFLDQEAEWASSVELVQAMMLHPSVIPEWYQVPLLLTNATSHVDYYLDAWHPGREWVHPRNPLAISEIDGPYPERFYKFFEWHELQQREPTAFLVGLRSNESLNRFRSVTKNPGFDGIAWSTRTRNPNVFRFYPVYDWFFGDVWKFIADNRLPYNRVYDRMFLKYGSDKSAMRVSNLVHEKAFHALTDLQEFEPDTYERMVRRLRGVHAAALYAEDRHIFSASDLPAAWPSWRAYRDYLLASTPAEFVDRFRRRFARQDSDEATCRQQVKQILLNDWEGSIPVLRQRASKLRGLWEHRV